MTAPDRYASITNTLIEIAKARGLEKPGSETAALCYELLEAAMTEAEVWDVPLEQIGLDNFDTGQFLKKPAV